MIDSLTPGGPLVWTYGFDSHTGRVARVEISTEPGLGVWTPLIYDFVSTNLNLPSFRLPVFYTPPTNVVRTVMTPTNKYPSAFYRVVVQTNIPDPSLVMHLTFNQDLSNGIVLDTSGYGNHGLRYGLTNWPTATTGPDGARAAEFHVFPTTNTLYYAIGQYVAVLASPVLDHLSNATFSAWAHYYTSLNGDPSNDHTSALMDASWGSTPGSWLLGRVYNNFTSFYVYTGVNSGASVLGFPDDSPTGNSGGWHHYVVTFDGTNLVGYFDGRPFGTSAALSSVGELRIGGDISQYIAISTWNHNGTPQFADDLYPNCCWMNGAIGDTRIYNRALSTNEVLALYNSFDHQPPTIPGNFYAIASASNQIELRWTPSSDNFYVAGYTVRRGGAVVGTLTHPAFVDTNVAQAFSYSYTVEAFDGAGNRSGETPTLVTNTAALGSSVLVIVDDADGPPQVNVQGSWNSYTGAGSFGEGFLAGLQANGAIGVTYAPTLPAAGDYNVYIWYGGALSSAPNYVFANNVPVDIVHGGVTNTVVVNQQQGYSDWALLGTFHFTLGTNEFVRIRTDGTANGSFGAVVADAVKFTK